MHLSLSFKGNYRKGDGDQVLRAEVFRRVGSDKDLWPQGLRDWGSAIATPLPVWCGYLFHGSLVY